MNHKLIRVVKLAGKQAVLDHMRFPPQEEDIAYCERKRWVQVRTREVWIADERRPNVGQWQSVQYLDLLPDGRDVLYEIAHESPPEERPGEQLTKRQTGRPRKNQGESDNDTKIIGALLKHHEYKQGGSVGNRNPIEPATKLAKDAGVTRMAVTRFMQKHFGERGYKGYVTACQRDKIDHKLIAWAGDVTRLLAALRPDESGRPDDE